MSTKRKLKTREQEVTLAVDSNTADIMQAAQKTKQANQRLARVLERNHITVKIYSQLGGKSKRAGVQ